MAVSTHYKYMVAEFFVPLLEASTKEHCMVNRESRLHGVNACDTTKDPMQDEAVEPFNLRQAVWF